MLDVEELQLGVGVGALVIVVHHGREIARSNAGSTHGQLQSVRPIKVFQERVAGLGGHLMHEVAGSIGEGAPEPKHFLEALAGVKLNSRGRGCRPGLPLRW